MASSSTVDWVTHPQPHSSLFRWERTERGEVCSPLQALRSYIEIDPFDFLLSLVLNVTLTKKKANKNNDNQHNKYEFSDHACLLTVPYTFCSTIFSFFYLSFFFYNKTNIFSPSADSFSKNMFDTLTKNHNIINSRCYGDGWDLKTYLASS